jgi:hypothetical protein
VAHAAARSRSAALESVKTTVLEAARAT